MVRKTDWTKEELEDKIVGKMTAVTVPVNMRLEGMHRVLDFSEMREILMDAELISLGECDCRKNLKKCDSPLDVCICLNEDAREQISKGLGAKVSLEEALGALRRSHKAGLVHIAYTFNESDRPNIVCSCCSCCCHSMGALVRFGISEAVVASRYVAKNNLETCIGCGTCVERCQFKARHIEEGKLVYDEARCFGCGLCVTTCPTKSISLEKRESNG
jgi:Na+-translocating ferredoxin:NAD+ oxidoreductase RNF subunit RnfB